MDFNKLINWRGISALLTGDSLIIRANRDNKKYSKEIKSLEKHLQAWAKENKIQEK
ncbi:MAG TPA: hypothetical protein VIV55_09990 [Flavobacterium sp.]